MTLALRFSIRRAVAMHLHFDEAALKDYRYQPTRTPCEVYSSPRGVSDYFTATRGGRKPKGDKEWVWQKVEALLPHGWNLWRAEDGQ